MTTPSLAYYSALGNATYCAPGACDKDYDDAWNMVIAAGWHPYAHQYNGVRYDVTNETTIWWVFFTEAGYQVNVPIILRWTNGPGYSDWPNSSQDRWVVNKSP